MTRRSWAEFRSDLPEDVIEDDEGFIERGGRGVTHAIASLLEQLGCQVDPPIYADEHGWEIDFHWRGRRLWCQITLIEGYIFVMEDPAWFSKRSKKNKAIYFDILTRFAEALSADHRFDNIGWYLSNDLLGGGPGAKRPVSD